MRAILCRLPVWILLVAETHGFSTHLRQRNTSIHIEARSHPTSDVLHSSESALDVTSILRIRASEYLELFWSTLGSAEASIEDRTFYNGSSQGLTPHRENSPHTLLLYGSTVYRRMSDSARFMVAVALVVGVLMICIVALPKDEDKVAPRALTDLYETNCCSGTWSRSYQNADTKDKQALEMLFRCHIIPADEFRHSTTKQAHIDDCIWIGRRMLVERSLEDWLDNCSDAQQKFEESLHACSEEKRKVRSGVSKAVDPTFESQASNFVRGMDVPLTTSERASQFSFAPQHVFLERDTPASAFSPEHAAILKSPDARHRLLLRCTEIMTEYDRERRATRRIPMSGSDMASPSITPPPTAGDVRNNPWPLPPSSSAPAGMYPQSARNDVSGIASGGESIPSNFYQMPRPP